jgi:hypothetical protein
MNSNGMPPSVRRGQLERKQTAKVKAILMATLGLVVINSLG